MLRISLLAAIGVMAAAAGCAQCDTCDDFPAPCVGPNCGGNTYNAPGYLPPTMGPNGPAPGSPDAPAASAPVDDRAPIDPLNPDAPSPTMPPGDSAPTTPPTPTEPPR